MDDYWFHAILAVMVLLNFFLNITSVYLGKYKKHLLEAQLQHILEHICPAYYEEDLMEDDEQHISELEKKISKDRANFESWDNPPEEE